MDPTTHLLLIIGAPGAPGIDPVTYAPLIIALAAIPAALIAGLTYLAKRPAPKDQDYYEKLVTRSRSEEDRARAERDRIQAELDKEIGRRERVEQELEQERGRAKQLIDEKDHQVANSLARVALLEHERDECRRRCRELELELGSMRKAMSKWTPPPQAGEQPA